MTKQLIPITPPIKTLLFICEKCGKKQLNDEIQENPAKIIQKTLKSKIKQTLPPGTGRVVTTSCLSVCPIDAITIGYIDSLSQNSTVNFYLLNEKDHQKAIDQLFQQFFFKI